MTEFYETPLESCGKSREYERTIDRNESKGKIHITLPLGLLHTNSARSSAAPPPNKIPELHVNSRRGEEPCAEALNSFKDLSDLPNSRPTAGLIAATSCHIQDY